MALTVTTTVSGSVEIESGIELSVNFNLPQEGESTIVNFSFVLDAITISGNFTNDKLTYYNVNSGIISEDIMQKVEDKIVEIVDEYTK